LEGDRGVLGATEGGWAIGGNVATHEASGVFLRVRVLPCLGPRTGAFHARYDPVLCLLPLQGACHRPQRGRGALRAVWGMHWTLRNPSPCLTRRAFWSSRHGQQRASAQDMLPLTRAYPAREAQGAASRTPITPPPPPPPGPPQPARSFTASTPRAALARRPPSTRSCAACARCRCRRSCCGAPTTPVSAHGGLAARRTSVP
jgi:hypothetical protein